MRRWTNVRIDRDLKALIDARRGLVPFARWVAMACEEQLKRGKR